MKKLRRNGEEKGAGIAQSVQRLGCGLDERRTGVLFPTRARDFLLSTNNVQTGSGVHPAFYPMGRGFLLYPGVKWRDSEGDTSSVAEVKNAWRCATVPSYVCYAWCIIKGTKEKSLSCQESIPACWKDFWFYTNTHFRVEKSATNCVRVRAHY
jgi:hypothetical protein